MKSMIYLSEASSTPVEALAGLEALYKVSGVDFENLTRDVLARASFLLINLQRVERDHALKLKELLSAFPGLPRAALIVRDRRQEFVQAQALGINECWDREESREFLVAKLRATLGSYGAPVLTGGVAEATRCGVLDACMAYEEIVIANAMSQPMPVKVARKAVMSMTEALKVDGLSVWLSAVEDHHSPTFCHCLSVSGLALRFGDLLGLTEKERHLLGLGALFHDIGKVKIPLSVLEKEGSLSEEERNLISLHPEYAREILEAHPEVPKEVRDMAFHHHEALDGSGYPYGLKGDEISRFVRILTICDIFSALVERRSYKGGQSPRQAFAMLYGMSGKIDMELLSRFKEMVVDAEVGALKAPMAPAQRLGSMAG